MECLHGARAPFGDRRARGGALEEAACGSLHLHYVDAAAGHGVPSTMLQLVRMSIEAGVSGSRMEAWKPGAKKCGHMGGKV